jgi:hypothetical protein
VCQVHAHSRGAHAQHAATLLASHPAGPAFSITGRRRSQAAAEDLPGPADYSSQKFRPDTRAFKIGTRCAQVGVPQGGGGCGPLHAPGVCDLPHSPRQLASPHQSSPTPCPVPCRLKDPGARSEVPAPGEYYNPGSSGNIGSSSAAARCFSMGRPPPAAAGGGKDQGRAWDDAPAPGQRLQLAARLGAATVTPCQDRSPRGGQPSGDCVVRLILAGWTPL